ncbi:MAG: cysteine--tRNA ligase [Firmicutes bacterium]|nr:cysteine--tRNA ligase [Bacillota bacterium]
MSVLKVYNTLTRQKDEFKPLRDGEVSFYVCGPTVYDYFHIGNARVFIVFDVIRRYLEYRGFKVKYVQNFTDIDDKLIRKAAQMGTSVSEVATRFIEAYFEDAARLGIRKATLHPRATESIEPIIGLIERLYEKGLAYQSGGDVLYDTERFPAYGKLSQQKQEELISGARVRVDENKRNPLDFVLWKAAKPGEPSWDSPWGSGRPGWHIECSAMSLNHLGDTIDIHAGGPDLIFPHHENEIAQSEGATGRPFVNYWLHAGYLNIDAEKMSKSLGNVLNIRDLIPRYNPLDIRFFMLSSHYRHPLNYSEKLLEAAMAGRNRLQTLYENLVSGLDRAGSFPYGTAEKSLERELSASRQKFKEAMDDDFNTAEAIGELFSLVRATNVYLACKKLDRDLLMAVREFIEEADEIFGIVDLEEESSLEERIKEAIERREEARRNKDWATADRIRDELDAEGITLEDTSHGVRWKTKSEKPG